MEIGVLRRDGRTDPFFDGAAAGRLMIRRCAGCASWYAPDASECPSCGGGELAWAEASGHATLVSWAISHGRPRADGSVPPPAVLALVELREGPWLHSRLDGPEGSDEPDGPDGPDGPVEVAGVAGVARADLREGLPLRAHFEHPDVGESYLVFKVVRPAPSAASGAADPHHPREEPRP